MSTYRRIRRQARRARRAGLHPAVVLDRALPPPAWLLSARLGWRYRSEIAPAAVAGAVLALGWWLHATDRIPAIESALGTYRRAVSVHSTRDGKANWCELRVLDPS
jgi:hypothetical protein